MKIGIYQPKYPKNMEETNQAIEKMIDVAKNQSSSLDLLVFPEYCNVPGMDDFDQMRAFIQSHSDPLLETYKKAAKKNQVHICINFLTHKNDGFYNTTILIDDQGEEQASYDKIHLSQTEKQYGLAPGEQPVHTEINGAKITFATCFDLYFSEFFESLAKHQPDIILCPSYQRNEASHILMAQAATRSVDTECFLIRASYTLGGNSLISNPLGQILCNAHSQDMLMTCTIDPKLKRLRTPSYGQNDPVTSRTIIEKHRRPDQYRMGGKSIKSTYPRICAHRGLSVACPENTLPAFGAAIAIGAHEIEFDIWATKDGHLVITHDPSIDRTTNGQGKIESLTLKQLHEADAGIVHGEQWKGLKIPLAEDVFSLFAQQTIMNIHIKDPGSNGFIVKKIIDLAYQYDNTHHIYIAGDKHVLKWAQDYDPSIERNCLERQGEYDILEWAQKFDCKRLQFFTNYTDEMVQKAKSLNMICNLFYADTPEDGQKALDRGIDTLLTNHAGVMLDALSL